MPSTILLIVGGLCLIGALCAARFDMRQDFAHINWLIVMLGLCAAAFGAMMIAIQIAMR